MAGDLTLPTFFPAATEFEVFGKYLLLKHLGAGGMAEVFLARPGVAQGNGRVLVIKRILPEMVGNSAFQKMFASEVQIMMGFNHPHTVQLHDFGDVKKQPYIAMEYIEGKTLKQIISKFKSKNEVIPVPMVLSILAQAATGLAYAHNFENRVTGEHINAVHRDISPQNLILSYDGNLKVIDFGIATNDMNTAERTRTGVIKGKVAYLSPEQILGKPLDGRTDIFSLGIVACELLTFKRPFTEENDTELSTIHKIENCDQVLKQPSILNKEVPPAVDELVLRMLKQDPDERFPTALALQNAIRQVMRQLYPTYSYSDTGELVRVLFEEDIATERAEIKQLNELAQEKLDAESASKSDNDGVITGVFNGIRSIAPETYEARIESLEGAFKQKATARHYVMMALFLASFAALKLDDRYGILDNILGPPSEVIALAEVVPAAAPSPSKVTTASVVSVVGQVSPIAPMVAIASVPKPAVVAAVRSVTRAPSSIYRTRFARSNANRQARRYQKKYAQQK